MFESASRMKLRFNYKGICSVEDLWDLPLTALDLVYRNLSKELKKENEESLLSTRSAEDKVLDLKIEIVKHIFTTKLAEKEKREAAAAKREQKQKIMSIIAEKQDKELYDKPLEELEKLVEEMD